MNYIFSGAICLLVAVVIVAVAGQIYDDVKPRGIGAPLSSSCLIGTETAFIAMARALEHAPNFDTHDLQFLAMVDQCAKARGE